MGTCVVFAAKMRSLDSYIESTAEHLLEKIVLKNCFIINCEYSTLLILLECHID